MLLQPTYYRRVIKIRAQDSPNVRLGLAQEAAGIEPTDELLVPGVLTYGEYKRRRKIWDKIRQCIGLDAEFYFGPEVLLYPPEWLNLAEAVAETLRPRRTTRVARALGIDPAEGGDKTAMAVVDELGLIELVSKKTPDTTVVTSEALAMMRKYNLTPEQVMFDRGGGGKEHADRLSLQGYDVRTVAFGEAPMLEPRRGMTRLEDKQDIREDHYAYKNRRAQMYAELRMLLDPALGTTDRPSFAIPAEYTNLRQELAPMPLLFDPEGRMRMLPKNKRDTDSKEATLTELIGHSPDEADALVIAIHCMRHRVHVVYAGAI